MKYLNTNNIEIWNYNQQLINKSTKAFIKPRQHPRDSLEYSSHFFNLIKGKIIIECGTGLQGEGSGNSMLYWFNKTNASTIHCIDLEAKWINSVKNELGEHSRIVYHNEDCFTIVPTISHIDLIYMDFWVGNGRAREKAYLELYKLSRHPKMILIDDSDHASPWKQTLIVPEAMGDGYKLIYIGRQTLLVRHDIAKEYNNFFESYSK
jgi:hypothetical protein